MKDPNKIFRGHLNSKHDGNFQPMTYINDKIRTNCYHIFILLHQKQLNSLIKKIQFINCFSLTRIKQDTVQNIQIKDNTIIKSELID